MLDEGFPRLNEVAVGLAVELHATDRFFGKIYSRRNQCTLLANDGLPNPPLAVPFNDIDATEFPITVHAAVRLSGNCSRHSSFAQYPTQFKTFNIQAVPADATSHTTTRKRACRSRRTSFASLFMPIEHQRDVLVERMHISKERHNYESVEDRSLTFSPTTDNALRNQRVTGRNSTSRRKRAREKQTSEQCAVRRAKDSARRRRARAALTSEQQARQRALDAARRKLARAMQTTEERNIQRAIDSARRRLARERKKCS